MSDNDETELSGADAFARVRALVADLGHAILTTAGASGDPEGRPVVTRLVDDTGDLWFFVIDDGAVAAAPGARVALSYVDAKSRRYVSVAGVAATVTDPARLHELYIGDLDIWFPNGLATPGIALLKVTPTRCEFWEPAHSRLASAARTIVGAATPEGPAFRHGVFVR